MIVTCQIHNSIDEWGAISIETVTIQPIETACNLGTWERSIKQAPCQIGWSELTIFVKNKWLRQIIKIIKQPKLLENWRHSPCQQAQIWSHHATPIANVGAEFGIIKLARISLEITRGRHRVHKTHTVRLDDKFTKPKNYNQKVVIQWAYFNP